MKNAASLKWAIYGLQAALIVILIFGIGFQVWFMRHEQADFEYSNQSLTKFQHKFNDILNTNGAVGAGLFIDKVAPSEQKLNNADASVVHSSCQVILIILAGGIVFSALSVVAFSKLQRAVAGTGNLPAGANQCADQRPE